MLSRGILLATTLTTCLSGGWGITVSEAYLESIRSPRPVSAQASPARNRTCLVDSHNDGVTDDSDSITETLASCNEGGHVIFPESLTYQVHKPLDMTNLSNVDIDIQGYITFSDDLKYWLNNSFNLQYQNATSFFMLGGSDVNVYGGGTLDGSGQPWWDNYPKNKNDKRPVLFATVGLNQGSISDISESPPIRSLPQ
jgi:galacturan 1,4-alpha-galacturonidase